MHTMLRSKSTFFGVGILVGIFSFWAASSLGHDTQTGAYAGAALSAALPAGSATTASGPSYSGTSSLVWRGHTDSSLDDYQLERAACCPGEGAK